MCGLIRRVGGGPRSTFRPLASPCVLEVCANARHTKEGCRYIQHCISFASSPLNAGRRSVFVVRSPCPQLPSLPSIHVPRAIVEERTRAGEVVPITPEQMDFITGEHTRCWRHSCYLALHPPNGRALPQCVARRPPIRQPLRMPPQGPNSFNPVPPSHHHRPCPATCNCSVIPKLDAASPPSQSRPPGPRSQALRPRRNAPAPAPGPHYSAHTRPLPSCHPAPTQTCPVAP